MRHHPGVDTRILLRRPRREDGARVHEWGTRPEVYRYQVWGPNTERQTQDFVADAVRSWEVPEAERIRWSWFADHADYGVVGAGDIHVRSRTHRQGEISYVVHPDHWAQGFGTTIGRLLLRIGFQQLSFHRVYATCNPRNAASAAILRKLGMTNEGRLRHTLLLRDGWADSEVFSILESEWSDSAQ